MQMFVPAARTVKAFRDVSGGIKKVDWFGF